jgi:hypothetical protein
VVITATDPNLLGRRMYAVYRELSDMVDLKLSYTVTGAAGDIATKAQDLADGDASQHGALADLLTSALKARGIEVKVQSLYPTPIPTPSPTAPPTLLDKSAKDVELEGTSPLLYAAIAVVALLAAGGVAFIFYSAEEARKKKAQQTKADEEAARLVEEAERQEDPNPVEHRHRRNEGFGEEAQGLEVSQREEPVGVFVTGSHGAHDAVGVTDVQVGEDIFPQPSLSLTYENEAYTTDPTAGVVAPASQRAGIGGFFRGFFCNACDTTEREPEEHITGGTDSGVGIRVTDHIRVQ